MKQEENSALPKEEKRIRITSDSSSESEQEENGVKYLKVF